MGWDGMGWGWDGMEWDGMGWDGMRWGGMGWDGVGWDTMVRKAIFEHPYRTLESSASGKAIFEHPLSYFKIKLLSSQEDSLRNHVC